MGTIRAELAPGVVVRREEFGALAYVPGRDHFFALDARHSALLDRLPLALPPGDPDAERLRLLAEIGIATAPGIAQRAFFGRSLVGEFAGPVVPAAPMVVNCFATAQCPLQCRYCHADDLMIGYRDSERPEWVDAVADTAGRTGAMVAVVTGGEPLIAPERAARLIAALAPRHAVVLDTSGAGDFAGVLPWVREHRVHVRVSMDSADPAVHDALRPISRRHLPLGTSSHAAARATIEAAVAAGVPCSVQTVVSARNQHPERLLALRDLVIELGVPTWVLHVMVPVGKAARPAAARLLPDLMIEDALRGTVKVAAQDQRPLDIRVTGTHRAPDAVLLVNARGELSSEQPAGAGKTVAAGTDPAAYFAAHINRAEHADRYLNGTLEAFAQPTGEPLPVR